MPAGYSKRSLVEKLGIKAGTRLVILGAPPAYAKTLGELPPGARRQPQLRGPLQFIQYFTKESRELESRFAALKRALAPDGALWISWPKGASKVPTDLSESVVREFGLRHGLWTSRFARWMKFGQASSSSAASRIGSRYQLRVALESTS